MTFSSVLTDNSLYFISKPDHMQYGVAFFPLREKHCIRFHSVASAVRRAKALTYPPHNFDFCCNQDHFHFCFLNISIVLRSLCFQLYRAYQIKSKKQKQQQKKNQPHFSSSNLVSTLSFETQSFEINFSSKEENNECGLT